MSDDVLAGRMAELKESATLAMNAKVKKLSAEGKTVYNMTVGELACDTPEYIKEYVATKLDQNKYTPPDGLPELRKKVADHCSEFYELDWIKPENVIVTASAKPALWAVYSALLDPDDEIIIPIPAWVSHLDLVKIAGAKIVTTQLDSNNDLDLDDIKTKITKKTKAILLNSPQNPTGGILSNEKLTQLAEIINKTNIVVITDEMYAKLVYVDGFVPVPKHGFKNIVIIGGFSKSQAITGWRIGYLIAQKPIANAVNKLLSHVTGNAPVLSQYAGIIAMENGDKQVDFEHLKSNWTFACSELGKIKNISFSKPGGAFFVFFDVRKMNPSSSSWCEELLEKTGVALVPGEAFYAPGFARMSFVGDRQKLETSIKLIKKFSESYK